MLTQIQRKKSQLSNWILVSFLLILTLSTLNTYFYEGADAPSQEFDRYHSLLDDKDFQDLSQFILKNKLGSLRFEKSVGKNRETWNMVSPRTLPATQELIESVLNELKEMRIRKIHSKDPINMANFSLDAPLLSVTLIDKNGEKKVLTQGLKKYNNETYVILSGKESIYQVNSLKTPLESLSLTNFVDSQVISLKSDNIASVKIFRGAKKQSNLQISMYKDAAAWKGRDGALLEPIKVKDYIKELSLLRSQLILDKQSEKLKAKLNDYLATPLYTLEIEDQNKNLFTYTLSRMVTSLPDIKVEKRQNFIIDASDRDYPYLVSKNFLSLFYKKQKTFRMRKAPFKKLFY